MEQKPKSVSQFSSKSRNAYVLEHLTNSLLELLIKKPINEISISELCEMAGVGRTSFYRNFQTKEDIIKAHIKYLFRDWTDEWKNNTELKFHELIYQMFSHLETNREFYSLLNKRGLTYLLKDLILDLCDFNPDQEAVSAYASVYFAFFLYGWIEVWFRRGMKETAAELSDNLKRAADSAKRK